MHYMGKLEFAQNASFGSATSVYYRLSHWPIWIWVFFIAPGPLTFSCFSGGFHLDHWPWLSRPRWYGHRRPPWPASRRRACPYILRFDEDKPNPLYRRICYTFAWNAVLSFTTLNLAGLVMAAATGVWHLKQIYFYAYSPLCAIILLLGILGKLPRVGPSTKGEGVERRYFYGSVWAVTAAQRRAAALEESFPEPAPAASPSWSSSLRSLPHRRSCCLARHVATNPSHSAPAS